MSWPERHLRRLSGPHLPQSRVRLKAILTSTAITKNEAGITKVTNETEATREEATKVEEHTAKMRIVTPTPTDVAENVEVNIVTPMKVERKR